jgi:hypothetical protein
MNRPEKRMLIKNNKKISGCLKLDIKTNDLYLNGLDEGN